MLYEHVRNKFDIWVDKIAPGNLHKPLSEKPATY